MVILKDDNGFSIMEAITVIVISGIITIIAINFINILAARPNSFTKNEASALMDEEIDRTINYRLLDDTAYLNKTGKLELIKTIIINGNLASVKISIYSKSKNKLILSNKFDMAK